jgi:hypothetical protein
MIGLGQQHPMEAPRMIYLLEFFGFLAVAILLAAGPLLARTLEFVRVHLREAIRDAKGYESLQARSDERAEIHDEIRRMTAILEVDRRGLKRERTLP